MEVIDGISVVEIHDLGNRFLISDMTRYFACAWSNNGVAHWGARERYRSLMDDMKRFTSSRTGIRYYVSCPTSMNDETIGQILRAREDGRYKTYAND